MYTENRKLREALQEKKILIAAHRGTCGGNICQNNRLSYKNALLHGADMIEIDVIKSADGIFYALHSGTEKENLHLEKDIHTMTSEEIEQLTLFNWLDQSSGVKLDRLEDLLDEFEPQCLINIDRSWFYWKEIIEFLKKRPGKESIILKSAPTEELLEILEAQGSELLYMPIMKRVEDWELVKRYQINVAAVEVIFPTDNHPLVARELFEEWKQAGILPWVNAITLGEAEAFRLSAQFDDNHAIAEGFDSSWGELVRMGFQIIQTDWPALLKQYLQENVR